MAGRGVRRLAGGGQRLRAATRRIRLPLHLPRWQPRQQKAPSDGLGRRLPVQRAGQLTRRATRRAPLHFPAVVTGLTGILGILSVLAPAISHNSRLEEFWSYDPYSGPTLARTVVLLDGFGLLFLSFGLWRRKRIAWATAVVLLVATTVAHLTKGHHQVVAIVSLLNLILLVAYRDRYRVRSDIPTIAQALIRSALAVLAAFAYGTLGFWVLDRHEFGINFTAGDALLRTLRLFFSPGDAGLDARTRYAAWFLDSFTFLGFFLFAYVAVALARPVVYRQHTLPAERARALALIQRYGDSSLDRFKTWPDKRFLFAGDGEHQGVISYGMALSVAIVLGDPAAADEAAFQTVLVDFLDYCEANDWRAAFHQVPPTHLEAYRAAGLTALKIGEDGVVNLEQFNLQSSAMRHIRSDVNRLERQEYRAVPYQPPLSDDLLGKLRLVSNEWLTIGRRERGFTLGRWDDSYVRECQVMTVEDSAGMVHAFANIIPDGAPGETTIDLMRRRADAPNAVMDFLFVHLFQQAQAAGYKRFSLGMAPFAEVGTKPGDPARERGLRLLASHLDRFFSAKGLRAYKEKFQPDWEPRYLVYQSDATLPLVTLALMRLTEGKEGERR